MSTNKSTKSSSAATKSAGQKSAGQSKATRKKGVKKVTRRNISSVVFHILATFNNTKIVATDNHGNVIKFSSAGGCNFKGSRKSTPYASSTAAEIVARYIQENYSIMDVEIRIKGPGPGREAAIRAIASIHKVKTVVDVTPLAHNGVRAKKRRRV